MITALLRVPLSLSKVTNDDVCNDDDDDDDDVEEVQQQQQHHNNWNNKCNNSKEGSRQLETKQIWKREIKQANKQTTSEGDQASKQTDNQQTTTLCFSSACCRQTIDHCFPFSVISLCSNPRP